MSARAPSCTGHEEMELDEFARSLQDLMPGRRTTVVMGADLNSTLKDILPTESDAHVGAAAELLDHMPNRNDFMEMLLDATRGLQMTWHNSYKRWWKNAWNDDYQLLNTSATERNYGAPRTSPPTHGRATSSGTRRAASSTTSVATLPALNVRFKDIFSDTGVL